jgi:hypothetical protein
MIVSLGAKIYYYVKENAAKDAIIQTLTSANETQKLAISQLELNVALTNKVIKLRDEQLEQLNDQLGHVTDDLGPSENDQAADSLKELIRRLSK